MKYKCNACGKDIPEKDITYGFIGTDPNNPIIDESEKNDSEEDMGMVCPHCGSKDIYIITKNIDIGKLENLNSSLEMFSDSISPVIQNIDSLLQSLVPSLESLKKAISNTALDSLSKSMSVFSEKMSSIINETLNDPFARITDQIKEMELKLPKIELPDIPDNVFKRLKILTIISEKQWPLFLYADKLLDDGLLKTKDKNELLKEEVDLVIYEKCDEEFIKEIKNRWLKNKNLNADRKNIIIHAIDKYLEHDYISCVSILACQMSGVILDMNISDNDVDKKVRKEDLIDTISFLSKKNSLIYKSKDYKRLLKKEKNMFTLAVCSIDVGPLYLHEILKYIYQIIFGSEENLSSGTNPCRNKICHGEQVNFNSKEYGLKSILTIDILIYILDCFNSI